MDTALYDIGKAHTDAILALYTPCQYDVFLVEVTKADADLTYPYVCVYPDPGVAALNSLAAATSDLTIGWQVTAVGRDPTETLAALDRTRMASHGVRPFVGGRTCSLVTQEAGVQPVRRDPVAHDPATARPVFYAVARFGFRSTPAV